MEADVELTAVVGNSPVALSQREEVRSGTDVDHEAVEVARRVKRPVGRRDESLTLGEDDKVLYSQCAAFEVGRAAREREAKPLDRARR